MTYDYSKLLGRIKEKGYTQISLAKRIGVSPTTLNVTLGNKRAFKQNEIMALCEALDVDLSTVDVYFFSH